MTFDEISQIRPPAFRVGAQRVRALPRAALVGAAGAFGAVVSLCVGLGRAGPDGKEGEVVW